MLSPFKTFLNNLQKNAGATIFGVSSPNAESASDAVDATANDADAIGDTSSTTTTTSNGDTSNYQRLPDGIDDSMPTILNDYPTGANASENPATEFTIASATANNSMSDSSSTVEFHIADDQLSQQSSDDPLSDPLAIEDCLQFDQMPDAIIAEVPAADTEITLVDVSSLTQNDVIAANPCMVVSTTNADGSSLRYDGGVADKNVDNVTINNNNNNNDEAGGRSDGSDSGLGLESRLCASTTTKPLQVVPCPPKPLRTALKRRSNTPMSSDDDPALCDDVDTISAVATKRHKRSIHFNDVTVYYFQRQQGFMCVPSQGGCSLGMTATHSYRRRFTLSEYAAEQRRVQRHKAQELKRSAGLPVSSSEDSAGGTDDEYADMKHDVVAILSSSSCSGSSSLTTPIGSANSENTLRTMGSVGQPTATAPLSTDSDDDNDTPCLQPVSVRQRRILLKAAGVRKIDPSEKKDCRIIQQSRDNCGCNCRGFCDPETCACAQSGIKCQVDRISYPCGCSRDGCGNPIGRAEFNKARVKTHYIHTFLRLQLESKPPPMPTMASSSSPRMLLPSMRAVANPAAATVGCLPSIANSWHSQMTRSLAAMSGDNLYNMNGASVTPPATMANDLMPLQLDQTPDLHAYAYADDAYDGGTNLGGGISVGGIGSCHTSSGGQQFDGYASAPAPGSGLNTPTNMCGASPTTTSAPPSFVVMSASIGTSASSLYSPDSATIVEPIPSSAAAAARPTPSTTQPSDAAATPTTTHPEQYQQHAYPPKYPLADHSPSMVVASPPYPDFGNITGYQHSYLFSLQNSTRPPTAQHRTTQHDNKNIGAYADLPYPYSLQKSPSMTNGNASCLTSATKTNTSYPANIVDRTQTLAAVDAAERLHLDLDFDVNFAVEPTANVVDATVVGQEDGDDASECHDDDDVNGRVKWPATTTSHDKLVGSRCDDYDLEPIDFESELGLATTFIHKSLKTCVTPGSVAADAAAVDVAAAAAASAAATAAASGGLTNDEPATTSSNGYYH